MNCPHCGAKVPYQNAPCPSCGQNTGTSANHNPPTIHQSSPYHLPSDTSYSDFPSSQNYSRSSYTPPPNPYHRYQKPSKKKWLIPLIAILAGLAVIAAAVPLTLSHQKQPESLPIFSEVSDLPENNFTSEPISQISSLPSVSQPTKSIPEGIPENTIPSEEQVSSVPTDQTTKELAAEVIPHFALKYWLNQCTDAELQFLCEVYQSLMRHDKICELSASIPVAELSELIPLMMAECPELFHFQHFSYYYGDDETITQKLEFQYNMTPEEYTSARSQCETVLNAIQSATQGMTDLQKETYIFDYLVSGCIYDKTTANCGTAYGVLVEQIGKCDGFARAVKWAMDTVGVPCLYVDGDSKKQGEEGHAWNIVLLDNQPYLLDVTMSTPLRGQTDVRHDHIMYHCLNIWDQWHLNDYIVHERYTSRNLPRCTTLSESYYAQSGQMVYAGEDLYQKFTASLNQTDSNQTVILQFESEADYQLFADNLNTYVKQWFQQSGFHKIHTSGSRFDSYHTYILFFTLS